uniref:Methyltransferase n=1 Tax=Streptomyces luteocolor TaxID=285500 RepID=A0A125SZC6_9ACTN|nr:methyltransferase [Streptomyces luteocolor]
MTTPFDRPVPYLPDPRGVTVTERHDQNTTSAHWARLGQVMRDLDWALRTESYRHAAGAPHQPWLPAEAADDPLYHLLHLGESQAAPPPELAAALAELGLYGASERGHRTAGHYFTAFRGLVTVADHHGRPARSGVYLGEDGLAFTDRLLSAHAHGTALDIGSGSGLTTSALAARGLHTTALDISADCVAATAATAALNGLAQRVETAQADATKTLGGGERYDFIASNPPGVVVPETLDYGPGGNGGPDGLAVVRAVTGGAPRMLRDGGTLLMRFESPGDARGPRILEEIFEQAGGSSVFVTVQSRLPMRTRSGLTALRAAAHNPELSPAELLRRLDAHTDALGAESFYTSFMLLRRDGRARREVHDLTGRRRTAGPVSARPEPPNGDVSQLPPGVTGLDWQPHLRLVRERWDDAAAAARRQGALDAVVAEVFGDAVERDPVHSRSLHALLSGLPGIA